MRILVLVLATAACVDRTVAPRIIDPCLQIGDTVGVLRAIDPTTHRITGCTFELQTAVACYPTQNVRRYGTKDCFIGTKYP